MTPAELASALRERAQTESPETALQRRSDLCERFGVDFFLKREDRIDDLGSGHKKRKLNYLRDTVRSEGANVLVTAGSLPSGQCVAVAAAARSWGLRSRLIYLGDEQCRPAEPAGHYLYASLLADRIDWFERTGWNRVDELLECIAQQEQDAGQRPFVIAPGIPAWPAQLGSVELGQQIGLQLQRLPQVNGRTHVIALVGSGGTCAGLAAASSLLDAGWVVHGICMHGGVVGLRARLEVLIARSCAALGVDLPGPTDLRLHEFAWSGAYADPNEFELAGLLRLLREHQLPLDPNYMTKVLLATESLVASHDIAPGERVVVVHSGGSVDFVAGTPNARSWLAHRHCDGS